MSYKQTPIKRKRNDWIGMLVELEVGESFIADIEDRNRIAASISANFKDTPYRFTTRKKDEFTLIIKRTD